MIGRLIAKLTVFALKHSKLSIEDKNLCTVALLDSLRALPIKSIIIINEQGLLLVNGEPLDHDQSVKIRDSARVMYASSFRKMVKTQISHLAVTIGVREGLNTDQILFSKAALWCLQEEEKLLKSIVGDEE